MKNIVILGAGKSSSYLIKYLSEQAEKHDWTIMVADQSEHLAREKTKGLTRSSAQAINTSDPSQLHQLIGEASLVISMLPPFMHLEVAQCCLHHGKPLLTASYLTDDIHQLDQQARKKGIPILMEMGLDPGLDHMSALQEINNIRQSGGEIFSFKSYTGGLIAPESDDNPWHYKITWNPRNVVLAGQGTVKYLADKKFKYIPYQSVFSRLQHISIPGAGDFEGYANRDSLKYTSVYGLQDISTFIRGTLRRPGYCAAWNALVKIGLTDDTFALENSASMSYRDFVSAFTTNETSDELEANFFQHCNLSPASPEAEKLRWLGIFSHEKINAVSATPAQILQEIIEKKWALKEDDKDMIVMQHEILYKQHGTPRKRTASLADIGKDRIYTAMAKTVGLPLGIAAKLLLTGEMELQGVHIPVIEKIYTPILKELEAHSIRFTIMDESI